MQLKNLMQRILTTQDLIFFLLSNALFSSLHPHILFWLIYFVYLLLNDPAAYFPAFIQDTWKEVN